MKKIVLLRHGESAWNKENRFTGWTDVDLTEKGVAEAEKAGVTLREYGFNFDKAYTSYLKRAVKTYDVNNCSCLKFDLLVCNPLLCKIPSILSKLYSNSFLSLEKIFK